MEYLYFHALEFVKVNNRLTERNVLEIVLMFGAKMGDLLSVFAVAPHAGAWVEIENCSGTTSTDTSLPTRERGLKYWYSSNSRHYPGRSPRGSVG